MPTYSLSPYISFIDNCLFPNYVHHGVFHRLTGEIFQPNEMVRSLLIGSREGKNIWFNQHDLRILGEGGIELRKLIEKEFLISAGHDPLTLVCNQYVGRPIQNPAVAYRSNSGEWLLVRTAMDHFVYSRKRNELPLVVEEKLSALAAEIFVQADGKRTLVQIFETLRDSDPRNILDDSEFREAIDFLTSQERQLIKCTAQADDLDDPFSPVNTVPRNLYHSDRWDEQHHDNGSRATIRDFHLDGIQDAAWEFDLIEPTVNHCFRFPHEALDGLDYGSRFCISTLRPEVVPVLDHSRPLNVLEVGGGTGSFASSFIKQAMKLGSSAVNGFDLNYHILDLSPALMASQRTVLSNLLPEGRHFQQDATEFDLPGHSFDLIICNEVIADFPVASVRRKSGNEFEDNNDRKWQGEGACYLDKYGLSATDAPDSFLVNAGAFRFVERAWKHLAPGGTLIVSEYGGEQLYPTPSYHLNHEEFSIHFGHLAACATKVGFHCRILTLKDFLSLDDEVEVLSGREEHILCLNHVFKSCGPTLPYAVISESDFKKNYQAIAEKIRLTGYSFLPIKTGYHFGPNIRDFFVLIMNRPG